MPTTKESPSVVRARIGAAVIVTIGEALAQARDGTPVDPVPEGPDSALEVLLAPVVEDRVTIAQVAPVPAATEDLARQVIVVRVPAVPEDLAASAGPMTVVPGVMIADFAGMIGVKTSLRSSLLPSESIFFRNQPRS